jgi:hypothetical protein
MCERNKCARFLLYLYVLGLSCLTPYIYNLCSQLQQISTCLQKKKSSLCEECFTQDYSTYPVTIMTVYVVNLFAFAVLTVYILYRRWQMRNGVLHDQLYSYIPR